MPAGEKPSEEVEALRESLKKKYTNFIDGINWNVLLWCFEFFGKGWRAQNGPYLEAVVPQLLSIMFLPCLTGQEAQL